MLRKMFTEHPESVDETYSEHLLSATLFALRMMAGGLACLIHGLLPFLFVQTGSSTIDDLHDRMVIKRRGQAKAPAQNRTGSQ